MDTLLPLASFAFITTFTPGPNNMLLLASGMRFGFYSTLPHILGIQAGICLQLVLSVMGFGYILLEVPAMSTVLKVFGTAYLLYLAWNLRPNAFAVTTPKNAKPFTFLQALLFQFINPKAWMITLTAGSLFLPNVSSHMLATLVLCLVFNCVGTSTTSSWALVGEVLHRYLSSHTWRQCFSVLMVVLILITAAGLWLN